MVLLLVGVLGSVALIDGANATTSFTKEREGATNLGRELLEVSRGVDYDKITSSSLPGELKSKPGYADESGGGGWQLIRRGVTYTVTASACAFDDATDGTASHDSTFCSSSATTPPGDSNPDDYRRVTFDISWTDRSKRPGKVSLTGVVTNPSGGLGPRISAFTCTSPSPSCVQPNKITSPASAVTFAVTSAAADAVRWSADDGSPGGDASGGPTSWSFSWNIGTPGAFACGATPSWLVDGDYLVTAQAFDSRGVPGDLKSLVVSLDRQAPASPCGLSGGFNAAFGIVDLQWLANPERDIVGYRIFRVKVNGEAADKEVCSLNTATTCYDSNPPSLSQNPTIQYYVVAYDGGGRSTAGPPITVSQVGNQAPQPPSNLTATFVDGAPTLTWTAATDPDGSIRFYRIYKDGTSLGKRYDATGAAGLTWSDKDESGGHEYWVTAVDDKFNESSPIGPVTP